MYIERLTNLSLVYDRYDIDVDVDVVFSRREIIKFNILKKCTSIF